MLIQALIERAFDERVCAMFQEKPEIKKFILNHERKKLCIENLRNAVRDMEFSKGTTLKNSHITLLGKEYAVTFSRLSLQYLEQDKMHYLDKQRKQEEQKIVDEIVSCFSETDSSRVL